jgi:hypothetical protein
VTRALVSSLFCVERQDWDGRGGEGGLYSVNGNSTEKGNTKSQMVHMRHMNVKAGKFIQNLNYEND